MPFATTAGPGTFLAHMWIGRRLVFPGYANTLAFIVSFIATLGLTSFGAHAAKQKTVRKDTAKGKLTSNVPQSQNRPAGKPSEYRSGSQCPRRSMPWKNGSISYTESGQARHSHKSWPVITFQMLRSSSGSAPSRAMAAAKIYPAAKKFISTSPSR